MEEESQLLSTLVDSFSCVIGLVSLIAGLIVLVYGVRQKDWTLMGGGILVWVFMYSVLCLTGFLLSGC